jgi:heme/copper-type cytochrome/quinol oxidase subunit 3
MIPYTVERRADTNVTNVTMGLWLFLASEVMLFGALFSCYALLRTAAPAWPSGRDVLQWPLGLANTVVLIVATTLVWRARSSAAQRPTPWLAGAALVALGFLAIKALEYRTEIAAGLLPAHSTFLALYYTLTGIHALHVAGGIIALGWVMAGARRVTPALTAGRVSAMAMYWTFVDAVWVIIFLLLYLS